MQTIALERENQRSYQKLVVALKASVGVPNLLIAVCANRSRRDQIVQSYEAELRNQDIRSYQVRLQRQEPSLRTALKKLAQAEPDLQPDRPAAITVLGADDLIGVKLGAARSEQDQFFSSLHWIRESLRAFRCPIVLWLNGVVLARFVEQAPDCWFCRSGVFWFTGRSLDPLPSHPTELTAPPSPDPIDYQRQPPEDLLNLIAATEAQNPKDPLLATLYDSLGHAYNRHFTQGRAIQRRAIAAFEKAIALQTELGLESDLICSLRQQGTLYFTLKDDVPKALERYKQSLKIAQKFDHHLEEASSLKAVGDVLQYQNRHGEALSYYKQALCLHRDVGSCLGEARCLLAIGDVLQCQDHYSEARSHYEQALCMCRDIDGVVGRITAANCLLAIGHVLQHQAYYSEALSHYEQALSLDRDAGDRLGEANCLLAIGDVLQYQNHYSEALSHYEQALYLHRDVGSRRGEANCLLAIGIVLQYQNHYSEALSHSEQALSLYRDIGNRFGEAYCLLVIGDVLQRQNRYSEALSHYEQALYLHRDVPSRRGKANCLLAIGEVLQCQHSSSKALGYYERALSLYRDIGDRFGEACCLKAIGWMLAVPKPLQRGIEPL